MTSLSPPEILLDFFVKDTLDVHFNFDEFTEGFQDRFLKVVDVTMSIYGLGAVKI